MKLPRLFILPALAAASLTSCVVPPYQEGPVHGSVGVSYQTYASLPSHYVGDAYYYGGRYYSGGRYESGRFHDHGRAYSNRYYHNGRYYYGGRHESHGGRGNGRHDSDYRGPGDRSGDRSGDRGPSWQPAHSGQPTVIRRY